MNILLLTLGNPLWQPGGGILALATLVLLLGLTQPQSWDIYAQVATGHTFLVGHHPHALPFAGCLQ